MSDYNKSLQNKLEINTDNYQEYAEKYTKIEIEIVPYQSVYDSDVIYYSNPQYKPFFHTYYNDKENEKGLFFKNRDNEIKKIKVVIHFQVKAIDNLFNSCSGVRIVNFKKFNRKDITSMGKIFNMS